MACRADNDWACEGYRNARWRPVSEVDRGDGTRFSVDAPVTAAIPLGEVGADDVHRVVVVVPRDVAISSHTLYFVASGWNAVADVVAVDVLAGGKEAPERVAEPVNDAIANPLVLEGESGEITLDLLVATRQPGEPMKRVDVSLELKKFFFPSELAEDGYDAEMQDYARHGSIWYTIDADRFGAYSLEIKSNYSVFNTWISVFEGTDPSDGTRIVEGESVVEFLAQQGETYLVQVWTNTPQRMPLRLMWNQREDQVPGNDNFDSRTELVGLRGDVEGSNYRATLEVFEYYGVSTGRSTWYRWTAPGTERFELSFPRTFQVLVFDGADAQSLRRVSAMPQKAQKTQFLAKEGREYQFVVLDTGEMLIADYELSWYPVERHLYGYAENDMRADAKVIEGASGSDFVHPYESRTVEPDEDARTGVGTSWWQWVPPADGRYLFKLDDHRFEQIAVFVGEPRDESESVDDEFVDAEFVDSGKSVTVDAVAENRYWVSLGFRLDAMFVDIDLEVDDSRFSWGPVPSNDMIAQAAALVGSSGSVSLDHTYATTSSDEPIGIRGHSSLWWSWEAPATGWQRFALADWEAAGLREPTQQSILAIYRRGSDGALNVIATSDHSYVINGRAEAIFRGEVDGEYLVQVALRTTDLGNWSKQTTFSYGPVDVPAWQRYEGRVVEVIGTSDEVEDDGLVTPRSVAVEEEAGLVVVATRENLVAYSEAADGSLASEAIVPYQTEDGTEITVLDHAVLHWDPQATVLYLVQKNRIFAVRGLDGGAKFLQRCPTSDSDGVVPMQVATDADSENLYVMGSGRMEVYSRTSACGFELLQVFNDRILNDPSPSITATTIYELIWARSLVVGPAGDRVYVMGEGLLIFERGENGVLSLKEILSPYRMVRETLCLAACGFSSFLG